MDTKSAEFWLRTILIDFRLPKNRNEGKSFFKKFGESYVLSIQVQYVTSTIKSKTIERFFVSIGKVKHVFQRTTFKFLFSIHVSEWEKIN